MNNRLIKRLKIQGYCEIPNEEMEKLGFGNRFAYFMCLSIFTLGFLLEDIRILAAINLVALGGVLLPYHPFDYLYNGIVRHWVNKPRLPKRSNQVKFACSLATIMIASIIYFYINSMNLAAYITGATLIGVAGLVSFTDICIPSLIYNYLFGYKVPEN